MVPVLSPLRRSIRGMEQGTDRSGFLQDPEGRKNRSESILKLKGGVISVHFRFSFIEKIKWKCKHYEGEPPALREFSLYEPF